MFDCKSCHTKIIFQYCIISHLPGENTGISSTDLRYHCRGNNRNRSVKTINRLMWCSSATLDHLINIFMATKYTMTSLDERHAAKTSANCIAKCVVFDLVYWNFKVKLKWVLKRDKKYILCKDLLVIIYFYLTVRSAKLKFQI